MNRPDFERNNDRSYPGIRAFTFGRAGYKTGGSGATRLRKKTLILP